ncbi:MAG: putative bifunctional diguanylate cyclase/phosphodiesterase [Acidiferrobacter sp.]
MNQGDTGSTEIEFLHRLARELDVSRFFRVAAEGLADRLGADGAALMVREEQGRLRYRFFHGVPTLHKSLGGYSFHDSLGAAGAALGTRQPIFVADYAGSAYALPEFVQAGLKASLCIPVIAQDEVLGVLAISWFHAPQRPPAETDLAFINIVSDFVASALHRYRTEQRLLDLATHDPLTGAANRTLFFDQINHAMGMAIRRERLMGLITFDIDNFKIINDKLGHLMGDALLVEVKNRVLDLIRTGDTLSRLGGDEFALILEDVRCYTDVETVIRRIRQTLRIRWGSAALQITVGISLGYTVYPVDDSDDQSLLHHADTAMYEAKRGGGNKGLLFTRAMARAAANESDLIVEFGKALEQKEMVLYFQPIVAIATGDMVSAEALIRWRHPTRGLLAPPQFMAALEHGYNSLKLDAWVLSEALKILARWQSKGIFKKLQINLSASSVDNHQFCETLERMLAASPSPIDPSYLGIELVEWSAIQDIESARALIMGCRALGISVALDDFGTGYASLQHLRSLPVDSIKIDRTFIAGLGTDPADRVLVQSMVNAAEAFGIDTVAEGIETTEQKHILLAMGCAWGQGYLFARPMPEEDLWPDTPKPP